MTQNIKNFIIKFSIAFGGTVLLALFIVFVLMRGVFCNAYVAKGNASLEKAEYDTAIGHFTTAKSWKKKNQQIYIGLAKAYAAKEDYIQANSIIDEAIGKKIGSAKSGIEQLHITKIKILSSSGKLIDAINYIDSIEDQYLFKKIQQVRPADIIYSPTQGSYDSMLKMKIEVRDGETVYYTTDGSYPTKFSNTYTAPINIKNGKTKITAIAVNGEGLVSPLLDVTYEVTNENEPVEFDDEKIEKMVRKALSKPRGVVLVKELASITELDNTDIDGYVRVLSDLDLMPNLEKLNLYGEKNMLSISQLSGKTKLRELGLAGCGLESEEINVLGSLTALEMLDISSNSLTSISALSEITTLKIVYIDKNSIADISPLSSSKDIEFISAVSNNITSIPDFESAQKLSSLILSGNNINDLSTVHRLTALTYLDLSDNAITNAKNLAALTELKTLILHSNPITNFDFVSELKKLTQLDVHSTEFINLAPLKDLRLSILDLNDTDVASLEGIEQFKSLTYLAIANTDVTDISAIAGLSELDYLDISNLKLQDPAPLFNMKGLCTLIAAGHDFKGIAFANPQITVIYE